MTQIPPARAYFALWPDPVSGRLRLRVLDGPPSAKQDAWLRVRGGWWRLADPAGQGIQAEYEALGRCHGFHDPAEVLAQLGRLAGEVGAWARDLQVRLA